MKYFLIILSVLISTNVFADLYTSKDEGVYQLQMNYLVENIQRIPNTSYDAPIETRFLLGTDRNGNHVYTSCVVLLISSPITPGYYVVITDVVSVTEVMESKDGHPIRLVVTQSPDKGEEVFEISAGLPMSLCVSDRLYQYYGEHYRLIGQ